MLKIEADTQHIKQLRNAAPLLFLEIVGSSNGLIK